MVKKNNAGMVAAEDGKPKKKKNVEKGYGTYLHKVMKQIHGDKKFTISAKGMELLDGLIQDIEERVSKRAFDLAKMQKKSTLAAPHIQTASKLVFPPEMGGMAISEGTKALTKFARA